MGLKKLYIDIPALVDSGVSTDEIKCEYLFHRKNAGQLSVIEAAQFAAFCRQCKESFCVDACSKEALEHQNDGVIKRYNMRCVGCKSCILACPFGTIFPETINYVTTNCDYCLNQLEENPDYEPSCTSTAPSNTFKMVELEIEKPEEHIYFAGKHLAVKSPSWLHKEERI